MTSKVEKPAKTKNFQIFVGAELQEESNSYEGIIKKLYELQSQNVEEIIIVNHVSEITRLYVKERYDKNYRVKAGIYKATSKAVSEEVAE